jgi:hypothetical protein
MAQRVAGEAEADLDDIWLYAAKESGSMDAATRLIDRITDRFSFLANSLTPDGSAMRISAGAHVASPWENMSLFTALRGTMCSFFALFTEEQNLEGLFER